MLTYLTQKTCQLFSEEEGATAVEYCVMLTVIIVALIGIFAAGDVNRIIFEDNSDKIVDALNQ